jgi:two-component system NarL family response regulator
MTTPLRIMLADDHRMFRDALRSLLEQANCHFKIVAEAGNGLEITRLVNSIRPDVICMDVGMPGMNGIEVTRRLIQAHPELKVIAVSAFADQRYILDMLDAGAVGYVTKAEAAEELVRAIRIVQNGQKYLCPTSASMVTNSLIRQRGSIAAPTQLGARERQVLQLVAEGHTSQQIADRLHIAHSTVEVHRRNIMRKLKLHSIAELTRYAINNGFAPN